MATTSRNADLQEAADKAARGFRNSAEIHQLAQEQDRAREALRRKAGIVNVAVELVREVRES